ncbi:MAG: hypothetical protein CME62_04955 [Halobacteriovoraceae bacterium]|nr:hypothetical protein [Halobacteriovoraceae bacterium]
MNYLYVYLAYGSLFILGFIDNSRGPIYPELLSQFQVTKVQGSLIFSLCSLSGFVVSLFVSRWLKFLGTIWATRVALLTDFLACILMGFAPSSYHGFIQFVIAGVILGIGMGMKGICANLLIRKASNHHNRRRLFSGLHTMYGMASFFAPFIIAELFQLGLGFQRIFLYTSVLPIVLLITTFKTKPYTIQYKKPDTSSLSGSKVILIASIFALYVSSEILVSSRLTIFLKEVHGYSLSQAAFNLSVFFGLLLVGRMSFGLFHVPFKSFNIMTGSIVLSFVVSILGMQFYPPLLALNGLSMSIFFPSAMDWVSEFFGEESEYVISRIMVTISGSLVAMHYIFGLFAEHFGLALSIWILPLLLFIAWYLLHFPLRKLTIS